MIITEPRGMRFAIIAMIVNASRLLCLQNTTRWPTCFKIFSLLYISMFYSWQKENYSYSANVFMNAWHTYNVYKCSIHTVRCISIYLTRTFSHFVVLPPGTKIDSIGICPILFKAQLHNKPGKLLARALHDKNSYATIPKLKALDGRITHHPTVISGLLRPF